MTNKKESKPPTPEPKPKPPAPEPKPKTLPVKDADSFTGCIDAKIWDNQDGMQGKAMVKGEVHRFLLQKPKGDISHILVYDNKNRLVRKIHQL